jgi:hypothetical protein
MCQLAQVPFTVHFVSASASAPPTISVMAVVISAWQARLA